MREKHQVYRKEERNPNVAMIWLYIRRQTAERSCLFRVWFQVGAHEGAHGTPEKALEARVASGHN